MSLFICFSFFVCNISVHAYSDPCLVTDSMNHQEVEGEEEGEEEESLDYTTSQMTNDTSQCINTYPFWAGYKKFKPIDQPCICDPITPSQIHCTCINPYIMAGEDMDYNEVIINISELQSSDDRSVVNSTDTNKDSDLTSGTDGRLIDENIKSASGQVIDYLSKRQATSTFPPQSPAATSSLSQARSGINLQETKLSRVEVDAETAGKQRQSEVERQLELERVHEIEIMKEWAYFKLMEQRNWDMDDPQVGWVPWMSWMQKQSDDNADVRGNFAVVAESFAQAKSHDLLEHVPAVNECPDLRKLNFNILRAIVDFVFE